MKYRASQSNNRILGKAASSSGADISQPETQNPTNDTTITGSIKSSFV